jgi:diadenosine tetraphosphate (Ap4A) HIT family hydrolase
MTLSTACPFCDPDPAVIIAANASCYARFDLFPANPGHVLVIPRRHVRSYFSLGAEELADLLALVGTCRRIIDAGYRPDGYNLGINIGRAAGQSVPHVHLHLIPRYRGDVREVRGGVRRVVNGTGEYPFAFDWDAVASPDSEDPPG